MISFDINNILSCIKVFFLARSLACSVEKQKRKKNMAQERSGRNKDWAICCCPPDTLSSAFEAFWSFCFFIMIVQFCSFALKWIENDFSSRSMGAVWWLGKLLRLMRLKSIWEILSLKAWGVLCLIGKDSLSKCLGIIWVLGWWRIKNILCSSSKVKNILCSPRNQSSNQHKIIVTQLTYTPHSMYPHIPRNLRSSQAACTENVCHDRYAIRYLSDDVSWWFNDARDSSAIAFSISEAKSNLIRHH